MTFRHRPDRFPAIYGSVSQEELAWYSSAACQLKPIHVDGIDIRYATSAEHRATAKQVCQECPVRVECLNFALAHNEKLGVWGGLDAEERKAYRRNWRRRRQLEAKWNAVAS